MSELTLYSYWRSSCSHRVRIALGLKGLAYRYVAVDLLAGEQSGADHVARSPNGYVPCLLLDDKSYFESAAIVELLDERFPSPPLYPRDPHARARVRALVEIVNSGIQPLQNTNVAQYVSQLVPEDVEARGRWLKHFIGRGMAALERAMEVCEREGVRGPFAYGDAPTAADVFLVPQVFSARRFGVDLAAAPRVARAFEAASALEAVRRAAPEEQPDAVTRR